MSQKYDAYFGLEKILDNCTVEKGIIWEINKANFTRQRPANESLDGYLFSVHMENEDMENFFTFAQDYKIMKMNYGRKLLDKPVLGYVLNNPNFKGENNIEKKLYGISFDLFDL